MKRTRKPTKVYKVLRTHTDGTLESINVRNELYVCPTQLHAWLCKYAPHTLTRARRGTRLFVFKHFEPACEFANFMGEGSIWLAATYSRPIRIVPFALTTMLPHEWHKRCVVTTTNTTVPPPFFSWAEQIYGVTSLMLINEVFNTNK